MAEPSISKEALRALAESAGLNIGDDVLEELLPRIRRPAETTASNVSARQMLKTSAMLSHR